MHKIKHVKFLFFLLAVFSFIFAATVSYANDRRMEALEKEIAILKAEMRKLSKTQKSRNSKSPNLSKQVQTLKKEVTSLKEELSISTQKEIRSYYDPPIQSGVRTDDDPPMLQMRGFGHVQYDYADTKSLSGSGLPSQDATNNFTNGGVDLFISSQISNSITFLNETLLEFGSDGENILDVERVMLRYHFRDWLQLSMGRGHTPLGYWNQTFHHGTWLHTTVDRPNLYLFEDDGGILPVHFVGAMAMGTIDFNIGSLSYNLTIANGRGDITDEVLLIEDKNDSKQAGFMARFEPNFIEGLGLGGNILIDVIPADPSTAGRSDEIDETIFGAHVFYLYDPIEFLWEHQVIQHNVLGGDKDHYGGYAQFALQINNKFKPYYRFDYLDIAPGDPFFVASQNAGAGTIESLHQHTVGVNYSWTPWASIKLEYRNLDSDTSASDQLTSQFAFAF
jgi:hypothetical protein